MDCARRHRLYTPRATAAAILGGACGVWWWGMVVQTVMVARVAEWSLCRPVFGQDPRGGVGR